MEKALGIINTHTDNKRNRRSPMEYITSSPNFKKSKKNYVMGYELSSRTKRILLSLFTAIVIVIIGTIFSIVLNVH
jgi:hypothetical protein